VHFFQFLLEKGDFFLVRAALNPRFLRHAVIIQISAKLH
jgi:hypothetical protein